MRTQLNRKLKKSYNKKRFYRLMKALGIRSIIRKKRPNYLKVLERHTAENLLNRNFSATAPNQKWSTDVTELRYGNGRKAYLSAIIDMYDNSIVSYSVGPSNNNMLVMETIHRAMKKNPKAQPIIQSNRGYQYTSHEYKQLSEKYHFTKSMSRVGRCLDNQPIDRFWGTYKAESFYIKKVDSYEAVCNDVSRYIRYYNMDQCQYLRQFF